MHTKKEFIQDIKENEHFKNSGNSFGFLSFLCIFVFQNLKS